MNTCNNQRTPGCDCSDYQLEQVGCQCVLVTLLVWPLGYPSDEGLKKVFVTGAADFHREVSRAFGPCATLNRVVYPWNPGPATVSNAAAAAYTRNDNS